MASQQAMDVAQPHVEHTPLLRTEDFTAEAEAETRPKQPSMKGKAGVAVLFAIAATAAVAGGVRSSIGGRSSASLKATDTDESADDSAISIQLDTDYTLRGDAAPGSDYPWMTYLLEPHKVTTASVVNGGSDSTFTWSFDGETKSGNAVDLQCKNADKYYTIAVDEFDADGNKLGG